MNALTPKAEAVAVVPQPGAPGKRTTKSSTRAMSERGVRRREAILAAATREFLENGYDRASIRTIIRDGGGSADAVYRQFGNKAGLFQAVITDQMQRHYQEFLGPETFDRPIAKELFEFGLAYASRVLSEDTLRFYRVMISGSGRVPEMVDIFWEAVSGHVAKRLEVYLREQNLRGVIHTPDPALAAVQFLDLTKAGMHIRLLCTDERPSPREIRRRVRAAVDLFLRGFAPQPAARA